MWYDIIWYDIFNRNWVDTWWQQIKQKKLDKATEEEQKQKAEERCEMEGGE
jgi:23S rRNA G2445 N2-methylase RlmL